MPMCYCFQTECRRWASTSSPGWFFLWLPFPLVVLLEFVGLTGWDAVRAEICRDAGKFEPGPRCFQSNANEGCPELWNMLRGSKPKTPSRL